MHISNQQAQVEHEFEQLREREITAVRSGPVVPNLSASLSEGDSQASVVQEKSNSYSVELSPDLLLKKKLIESVSGKSIETYSDILSHKDHLSIAEKSFSLFAMQYSEVFTLDGHLVTETSQLSVKEHLYEYERMDYATSLSLQNEDGSYNELSLSLSFSRELDIKRELSMSVAEFKDPLILNLGGNPKLLDSSTHDFDLDGDGQKESIPGLTKGVWFLAFDRNENGRIDDGTELFGAKTGDGFAELSEFDSNGNGLIENQDSHYTHLQLWNGASALKSLSRSGVSAISLNAASTPFTFTDNQGEAIAQLRKTSVFVTDKQSLGAIHHVDIAV